MGPIGQVLRALEAMVVPTIQAEEALMIGGETKNVFEEYKYKYQNMY